jgi:hypothetical protein
MAIIDPWNIPIDINSYEYAIKGNMIKYQISVSEYELMKIDPKTFQDDIKKQLMYGLIDELMKTRSVEFTRAQDVSYASFDSTHFRARMFVVPDDQVRILRVSQLNNTIT